VPVFVLGQHVGRQKLSNAALLGSQVVVVELHEASIQGSWVCRSPEVDRVEVVLGPGGIDGDEMLGVGIGVEFKETEVLIVGVFHFCYIL
jgi:hypothetical protein